jgi:hypothetical protein
LGIPNPNHVRVGAAAKEAVRGTAARTDGPVWCGEGVGCGEDTISCCNNPWLRNQEWVIDVVGTHTHTHTFSLTHTSNVDTEEWERVSSHSTPTRERCARRESACGEMEREDGRSGGGGPGCAWVCGGVGECDDFRTPAACAVYNSIHMIALWPG